MSTCPAFDHLLVVPHLLVQNANAVSSPLTHGFPSMTAFLGVMWALQRATHGAGLDLSFDAVGVVCHDHQEQVTDGGFVKAFHLTRNPVGKDGKTAAIVEEGRIHLDISLVFAARSERWLRDPQRREADLATVAQIVSGLRIAGGSVRPPQHPARHRYRPWVVDLTGSAEDRAAQFRRAKMRLLPGFSLVSRADLLEQRGAQLRETNPAASRLDAWLSLSRINWSWTTTDIDGEQGWSNDRAGRGWIVPIPVGYGALGALQPAGSVANTRDPGTPFRFVESLYSVGQWLSPHRLDSAQQLLWYADSRSGESAYRCRNDYVPPDAVADMFDSIDFDFLLD